ncbi:MAG: hypothetical protein AAF485_25445 [Chloroflexota bacterium]
MIALLFILLGSLILLLGLALIGPQVNVHEIDPASKAAWIFRGGAGMLILGEIVAFITSVDPAIVTVCLIMGGATLFSSLIILSHERQQSNYQFSRSLSLQIFGLGAVILIMALLLR